MSINFMKVHQPNLPHPDFVHKSMAKTKFADSIVEADTRIGHVLDKIRQLGLDKNTYVFWTTDNGAWQDVYPDAGYCPSAATRAQTGKGETAFRPWPGLRSSRGPGTTTSSGASTTWPPSLLWRG
jgi:arylsulfatase A-like enzyme